MTIARKFTAAEVRSLLETRKRETELEKLVIQENDRRAKRRITTFEPEKPLFDEKDLIDFPHGQLDHSVLSTFSLDLTRQSFYVQSSMFPELQPNSKSNENITPFVNEFVKKKLRMDVEKTLALSHQWYWQGVKDSHLKIFNRSSSILTLQAENTIINLIQDNDGKTYLEIVSNNLYIQSPTRNDGIKFYLPGTIHARHELTPEGFKFLDIELSNSALEQHLRYLYLRNPEEPFNAYHFAGDVINTYQEEINSLDIVIKACPEASLRQVAKEFQSIIQAFVRNKNYLLLQEYLSVLALVKQLLVDPYNDTLLLAFEEIFKPHTTRNDVGEYPSIFAHAGNIVEAKNNFIQAIKKVKRTKQTLVDYLTDEKVNKVLVHNISKYKTLAEANRYFNDLHLELDSEGHIIKKTNHLASYENLFISDLLHAIKEDIKANHVIVVEAIVKHAKAIAIHEILLPNGDIKPEILKVLKQAHMPDWSEAELAELKWKLLNSYYCEFISEKILQLLKQHPSLTDLSLAFNRLDENPPTMNEAYLANFDNELRTSIPQNPPTAIGKAIKRFMQEKEDPKFHANQKVRNELMQTVANTTKNNGARFNGRVLVHNNDIISRNKTIKADEKYPPLTDVMRTANAVINDPSQVNQSNYQDATKTLLKYSWGKIFGGIAIGLLGALVVGASVGIAAATFGAGAHIGVLGALFGAHLIGTGIAVGTGLSIGLGATAFGGWLTGKETSLRSLVAPKEIYSPRVFGR